MKGDQFNQRKPRFDKQKNNNNDQRKRQPIQRDSEEDRRTLMIKNIPDYYNSVENISKFYKKFGAIENIQVFQKDHSAVVQFMKELDAVKAFNSNVLLFGKKEIIVSIKGRTAKERQEDKDNKMNEENANNGKDDTSETPRKESSENESKQPQNALLKAKMNRANNMRLQKEKEDLKTRICAKITSKIRFIMLLRNLHQEPTLKNDLFTIIKTLNGQKEEIVKGKFDETLKEVYEKEFNDHSFDFRIVFDELPEELLNYKVIQDKAEVL